MQYHIIIFPVSSAGQSQHRKASRRQCRPTGFFHQSLRSSTTANQGERTTLNSHVLLPPRDLCQADDMAISNCKNHLSPLVFNIKKLKSYMKESPEATEHPQTGLSTGSRTANKQTAVHWEEPSTAVQPHPACEDKRGQHSLWKAVLGQSLKQQADNPAPRKRTVSKVCRHQD